MTDQIRDRIRAIIAEQAMLEPDQISDESTPQDLGIDSLGLVESSLIWSGSSIACSAMIALMRSWVRSVMKPPAQPFSNNRVTVS